MSLRIEVVTAEPQDSSDPRGSAGGAVDPVCGMIEPAGGAWERIEHDGEQLRLVPATVRVQMAAGIEQGAARQRRLEVTGTTRAG